MRLFSDGANTIKTTRQKLHINEALLTFISLPSTVCSCLQLVGRLGATEGRPAPTGILFSPPLLMPPPSPATPPHFPTHPLYIYSVTCTSYHSGLDDTGLDQLNRYVGADHARLRDPNLRPVSVLPLPAVPAASPAAPCPGLDESDLGGDDSSNGRGVVVHSGRGKAWVVVDSAAPL